MTKRAVEHSFDGATTPYTSYDSTKTSLGKLIVQKLDETGASFAGPMPVGVTRPCEVGMVVLPSPACVSAIPFSSTVDWIFMGDGAGAAATRVVKKYTFNRTTSQFTFCGSITLTFPSTGNKTTTGIRAMRYTYSQGSVTASGTAVSGSGTAWSSIGFAAGSRIGFGSDDPTRITRWYEIAAINSDTSITLTGAVDNTLGDSSYVIEEIRLLYAFTSTTADQGGIVLVKGLNPWVFALTASTVVPAAVSTDNVRAVYWLKDVNIATTTAICGAVVLPEWSLADHRCYAINRDTTSIIRVYSFNLRAALTVVGGGASENAFTFKTGTFTVTFTGIITGNNASWCPNNRNLWFTTSTTIPCLMSIPETNIADGANPSPTESQQQGPFFNTFMNESTSGYSDLESLPDLNLMLATGFKTYAFSTRNTGGNSGLHAGLCIDMHSNQSAAVPFNPLPHLDRNPTAWPIHTSYQNGVLYVLRSAFGNTGAVGTQVYAIPLGAHWDYADGQGNPANQERLITQSIPTPDAAKLLRLYVSRPTLYGSEYIGVPYESVRMYVRTSGIADDSGNWIRIINGDLSGVSPTSEIQVMLEFRIFGNVLVPAKVYGVSVVYEDTSTDDHFVPSVSHSNNGANQFAWKFDTRFHSPINLRVVLQDAETDAVLLNDYTDFSDGLFEKSTDNGQTWANWDSNELSNTTTYVRYTPPSLPPEILVSAKLTAETRPTGGASCSGSAYYWVKTEHMSGGIQSGGWADISQSLPLAVFGGVSLGGLPKVDRNRHDVGGGATTGGSAAYWSNPERMYGGVVLHGKCDEGVIRDILFVKGDKQDVILKTPNITPTGVDDFLVGLALDETTLHGAGGTLIMSTTGTLNPAGDIVSDLGSITMIIPSGTVNEPVDILVDGDFDQIPETEYVGVPNAVIRLPKKVR